MEESVQRPSGDILEEIFSRGPGAFVANVRKYPASFASNRAAILIAGLSLGEEVRSTLLDWVSVPDSRDKWSLMVGMAEMGFADVEGYFLRFLREKNSERPPTVAVRALGNIRGQRGLAALITALADEYLFAAACDALAVHGAPEALNALEKYAETPEAFLALSRAGGEAYRLLFAAGLSREAPFNVASARALGRIGVREDGALLLPCLTSEDPDLAKAAYEAYALLGAPEGVTPLLTVSTQRGLEPWMVKSLGRMDAPEAHAFLIKSIQAPSRPTSLWKRLVGWMKQNETGDNTEIIRALARARDLEILGWLAKQITRDATPRLLSAVLSNPEVCRLPEAEQPLLEVLLRGDIHSSYLVAKAWSGAPSGFYVSRSLRYLQRNGFVEMDQTWGVADEDRLMESCARDNNPCLMLGGFLDSDALDCEAILPSLLRRFVRWEFPKPLREEDLFAADDSFIRLFDKFDEAHPAFEEHLDRLWGLLLEEEADGSPLFELFWSQTGLHRGGVQRLIARRMVESVRLWTAGKDDSFLPELDRAAADIPREGRLGVRLGAIFETTRTRLKAQCKDMVVWMEGGRQGDMVLIDKI